MTCIPSSRFAGLCPRRLLNPAPAFEQNTIVDAESDSGLDLAPRFGAECRISVAPPPWTYCPGFTRDVSALFGPQAAEERPGA